MKQISSDRPERSNSGGSGSPVRLSRSTSRYPFLPLIIIFIFIPNIIIAGECDQHFHGLYTWGEGVDIFKPCGSEKAYWVSASSWIRGPLMEFYTKNTVKPYQSIYIKFRGHLLDEEIDGFAEDYDGMIRVSEIFIKTNKIPDECKKLTHDK